jgi:hypothetical protein
MKSMMKFGSLIGLVATAGGMVIAKKMSGKLDDKVILGIGLLGTMISLKIPYVGSFAKGVVLGSNLVLSYLAKI